jgi:hypothetical protein
MSRYEVTVTIELELADDGDVSDETKEDAQFDEAFRQADVIMQRAWDTDRGRHHVKKWDYTMREGAATRVDGVAGDPISVVD